MNLNIFVLLVLLFCFGYVDSIVSASNGITETETRILAKEEPRKKQQNNNLMSRILPMLATPFIMQVTILPLILMGMKFTLLSSMFLGKLGIILWIIHLIGNRNNDGGGLYSHNINVEHNDHIGHHNAQKNYQYSEHYNWERRKKRRRRDVLR